MTGPARIETPDDRQRTQVIADLAEFIHRGVWHAGATCHGDSCDGGPGGLDLELAEQALAYLADVHGWGPTEPLPDVPAAQAAVLTALSARLIQLRDALRDKRPDGWALGVEDAARAARDLATEVDGRGAETRLEWGVSHPDRVHISGYGGEAAAREAVARHHKGRVVFQVVTRGPWTTAPRQPRPARTEETPDDH